MHRPVDMMQNSAALLQTKVQSPCRAAAHIDGINQTGRRLLKERKEPNLIIFTGLGGEIPALVFRARVIQIVISVHVIALYN